jgi:hypothetical protein
VIDVADLCRSAPAWVNFTKVPLSCSTSQPLAMARSSPALYSAGVPLSCWTGSNSLVSSKSFARNVGIGAGTGLGELHDPFHGFQPRPLVVVAGGYDFLERIAASLVGAHQSNLVLINRMETRVRVVTIAMSLSLLSSWDRQ